MEQKICPECGAVVEESAWWDDDPENGGSCIGYQLDCPECGRHESF